MPIPDSLFSLQEQVELEERERESKGESKKTRSDFREV